MAHPRHPNAKQTVSSNQQQQQQPATTTASLANKSQRYNVTTRHQAEAGQMEVCRVVKTTEGLKTYNCYTESELLACRAKGRHVPAP